MRYPSNRVTSVHAIFLRATFFRIRHLFTPKESHLQRRNSTQINLVAVLVKTFSADAAIWLSGWMLSVLAHWSVATVPVPYEKAASLLPPQWLIFVVGLSLPSAWLAADTTKALSYPQLLPFAGLPSVLKKVYESRLHQLLLTFCAMTTLILLCWLATEMPLASKLFVSAVFAIALHTLNQKTGSRRRSLLVSSLLFLALLIASQAIITARLTASFVEDKLAPLTLLNELGFGRQKREFPLND